jgi:hypothetical protein
MGLHDSTNHTLTLACMNQNMFVLLIRKVSEFPALNLTSLVNPDTYLSYRDEIPQIWGYSCGRNRGVFVSNPPDGHTYSCAKFPPQWFGSFTIFFFLLLSFFSRGIKNVEQMNNFSSYTPEQGVNALDQFIRAVYSSSIDKDIGACDFESLSEFVCGREDPWKTAAWYDKLHAPIRGGWFLSLMLLPSS